MTKKLVVFIVVWSSAAFLWAGDAHYWTNQYGTKSDLLSGAVVGSLVDASQAYYNPGALGMMKDRSLVLSGSAFEYATVQIGQGDREKLNTTNADFLPNFLAGTLPFVGPDGQTLSYSLFTRQTFDADLVQRRQAVLDVLPESPGSEDYAAKNTFEQHMNEMWIGLTWARPLGEHVGVGVTQFFAYRTQRSRFETFASAFSPTTGQLATFSSFREGDYSHLRVLWKPGILVDFKPLKMGVAVTTPGMGIFGSGNAYTYQASTGVASPVFNQSFQEGVTAHYHSPWSAAFGASYETARTTYYASAEWYDAVRVFNVLDVSPYLSQSAGTTTTPQIQQALKAVWNFAFGVEHKLYEKISLYGSVATDRSALDQQSDVSFDPWNTIQFLVGTSFRFKKMSVTFGTGYGFGSGNTKSNPNFTNPSEANNLLGDSAPAPIDYRRFKFIFGFNFDLPDVTKKSEEK